MLSANTVSTAQSRCTTHETLHRRANLAGAHEVDSVLQLVAPVTAHAAHLLGADDLAAGRTQRGMLNAEILIDREAGRSGLSEVRNLHTMPRKGGLCEVRDGSGNEARTRGKLWVSTKLSGIRPNT